MYKRILLINPPLYEYSKVEKINIEMIPPLGVGFIAQVAKDLKIDVKIIDAEYLHYSIYKIIDEIVNFKPDLLGFSITTPTYDIVSKILSKFTKKLTKNFKIIVGGPHVTIIKRKVLIENPLIDACFIGEAENSFKDFLIGKKPSEINGLIYRDEKYKICGNENVSRVANLDEISIVNPLLLRERNDIQKHRKWYLITSRGCPFNCAFCSANIVSGSKIRFRSAENIIHEIKKLIHDFNIREIDFEDDNFILSEERSINFCNCLIKNNCNIKWRCLARADIISSFSLSTLIKQSGCYKISIGIESASEEILKKVKNTDLNKIRTAIQKLKSVGIKVKGYFILNFPFESENTLKTTRKFILSSKLDDINISVLRLFPGTQLYDYCVNNKIINIYDASDYLQFKYYKKGGKRERKAALYLVSHFAPLNDFSPYKIVDEIYSIYNEFYSVSNGGKRD
jgi:radical SAM superfamily enzyme YgiQ (UPF0313 family)